MVNFRISSIALLHYFKVSLFNNCIYCCSHFFIIELCNVALWRGIIIIYSKNRSTVWLVSFNMKFDWPVVNYQLFEISNIVDIWVSFLFIKLSMLYYFNNVFFKVVYSMLRFFYCFPLFSMILFQIFVYIF